MGAVFAKASTTSYNEGLRKYMLGVYNYMTLALMLSSITAYLAFRSGFSITLLRSGIGIVFMFLPLGISFYLSARLMSAKLETIKKLFVIYSISMGVAFSTLFLQFAAFDIAKAFFITASMFGSMSIYGYTTNKDLSQYSSIFSMLIIGLLISSIINIFTHSSAFSFAISCVSVLVFTALVAFDTQNIKRMYYSVGGNVDIATRIGIFGALQLYMDFIAIFIHLLNIFGLSKRD